LVEVTLSTALSLVIVGLIYSAVQTTLRAAAAANQIGEQIALLDMAFAQALRGADTKSSAGVTLVPTGNPMGRAAVTMTRQPVASATPTSEMNVATGAVSSSVRTLFYRSTITLGTDPLTGVSATTWIATHGAR